MCKLDQNSFGKRLAAGFAIIIFLLLSVSPVILVAIMVMQGHIWI